MREYIYVMADDYSDSGNRVARYLECEVGTSPYRHVPFMIRYGEATAISYKPEIEFNTREAILLASNKYQALERLCNSNINVPIFSKPNKYAYITRSIGYPLVLRTIHHSQGRGFWIINNQNQLRNFNYIHDVNDHYVMEKLNILKEFRALCFHNSVLFVDRKKEGDEVSDEVIRNFENGWNFITLSPRSSPRTCRNIGQIGIRSINALGLDFGAVDVALCSNGSKLVLEVNTAPGLRVGKAKALAQTILHDIERRT